MYRPDDLGLLLPSFQPVANRILFEMRELGYDPCPFDTLRTPAEAAKNFARGVGSKNSMHLYGAAMDVICNRHGWGCSASGCRFFADYGLVVEALGMVWGGRWARHDLVHVQCVAFADQARFRALRPEFRDSFVAPRCTSSTATPALR